MVALSYAVLISGMFSDWGVHVQSKDQDLEH